MNITEIESDLQELVDKPFDPRTFVFRLLEIYKAPKATVTKLKQGASNQAKNAGDVLWKNKLFFRVAAKGQSANTVDAMCSDPLVKKHHPRLIFATDGREVYCKDVKADQAIDPPFKRLNDHFLFLLPLANIERYEAPSENPADIKATGRIAKLYDAILEANRDWIQRDYTHDLNQFMARVLFCFFAEDTSIFEKDIFTSTVLDRTQEDGSDTSSVLAILFDAMNTKPEERKRLPAFAKSFPYVNGGLFRDKTEVPKFSKRARRLLKECGELYWKDINPDIFGSMIQAVAQPGLREDMGMHYTSVPNIMKVLQSLFLNGLEEEFFAAKDSESRLGRLLERIYNIRVFDPACGSGNFLIIAYKELRKLEMRIFERQKVIARQWRLPMTQVKLTQFYGIELTDFAAETAKLSLWIAEYQMNEVLKATFGEAPPTLPLRDSGNIIQGNAAGIDWSSACPPKKNAETFIVGNPPYLGSGNQSPEQKDDMQRVFKPLLKTYKDLDYVAIWFVKSAEYCQRFSAESGLVATNSICQGEQVAMLWPLIFERDVEIGFAHQSFRWHNSAANKAVVTCVIVGLRKRQKRAKVLYSGSISRAVRNIGPYLIEMDDLIVVKRRLPLSAISKMDYGNKPTDDGEFILSNEERQSLIAAHPKATSLIRRYIGSREFIQGDERWCLWIEDRDLKLAASIRPIADRIEKVRRFRTRSVGKQANDNARTPHRFVFAPHRDTNNIVVPRHVSEDRQYFTVGFNDGRDVVIADSAAAVYSAPGYVFSLLSSKLHLVWLATVGGKIKTDYRYSNTLVYNTFPVPFLSEDQRLALEDHALDILGIRETFPGQTIAWLYDPETMPGELLDAHRRLDTTLETIYIGRPFRDDNERLEHLFRRYLAMCKAEAASDTAVRRTA